MLRAYRLRHLTRHSPRALHTSSVRLAAERFDPSNIERPEDEVDVCIVGGGPAGLSAAIRLKQLEQSRGKEIRVVVLEKGPEVGAHLLSGAVLDPRGLDELLPEWRDMPDHPITQPATSTSMKFLTERYAIPMPHPPQMSHKGQYVISLSRVGAWMGQIAEEMGVEVYPGFAGAGLIYSEDGKSVCGVRTGEVGVDREGNMKDRFEPGMEFRAKVTLLAEGAHGSLSKNLISRFELRKGKDPQTYAIGIKEVWRVADEKYKPGAVLHTMGWPIDYKTYGGGWVYHMDGGLVTLGLVIGLDYSNPYLSPYAEMQRMKHHPLLRDLLNGGERVAYGARTLVEGGLQSLPQLHFSGGALIGCAAGMVDVARIKGNHNAMKSGKMAAEAAYDAIHGKEDAESPLSEGPVDMSAYSDAFKASWIYKDLYSVRNLRPSFNTSLGLWGGIAYSGLDTLFLKGRTPWTFRNTSGVTDAEHTRKASECKEIVYPKWEPGLSWPLLDSVALTGTNHAEDQRVHLRVRARSGPYANAKDAPTAAVDPPGVGEGFKERAEHVERNIRDYAGLLGRACPAAVYEYVDAEGGNSKKIEEAGWEGKKLVINSQNCIHCKLCDIKVPTQDIAWTVPEGGGGPKYSLT